MRGNAMSNLQNVLIPFVLGAIAVVIIYTHQTGKVLPLISGPRATLVALFIVGFTMCAFGIKQVSTSGHWASPMAIVGYLLGAIILVVFVSALMGRNLPFVQNDDQAVLAIALLMGVKFLIGMTSSFLHLL
jgi:peptidoglycan/LPS O-acetylase OafA/YrhL